MDAVFASSSAILPPATGQLAFLAPDSAVDYRTFGGGFGGDSGFLNIFPRGDALLLGGMFRLNDGSRNVAAEETERIVQQHKKFFDSFG